MSVDNTGRLYLERQITLARAVIAALSLVALVETSVAPVRRVSIFFLSAYLATARLQAGSPETAETSPPRVRKRKGEER